MPGLGHPSWEDVRVGGRLLADLPGFLRRPVALSEARARISQWQARRPADFLALARWAIYGQAGSPYRRLLALAGCEYGDLERLVVQEGLEGALRALHHQGVFLTVDELKGRQAVLRGSTSFDLDPRRLRNPHTAPALVSQSGGSRGSPTEVPIGLADVRSRAFVLKTLFDALGGRDWRVAAWGVPGGMMIEVALEYAICGLPLEAWFSRVDPRDPGLSPRYRWSVWILRLGALAAGRMIPRPRYVPTTGALSIVRWIADTLQRGLTPYLMTSSGAAVLLCEQSAAAGLEIRGARFLAWGEPLTAARLTTIQKAGASALPRYSSAECRGIAYGCLAPEAPDDMHLLPGLNALIQAGEVGSGSDATLLPADALLVTSLRPTAPLILLNVSLGDRADISARSCGCPLEHLGWSPHIKNVRSFEKLTAGGMTFLDIDVVRVLEELLPTRFGGGPTDYQLLEEEAADGSPRITLLVHPRVGPLDESAVVDAFLTAIGRRDGPEQVMVLEWRNSGLLRVERRPPRATLVGKIHHLHVSRPDRP